MDNDRDVYTPLMLNNIQSNNLIKILLDRVYHLECEAFNKQTEIDSLTGNLNYSEECLENLRKHYSDLQDEVNNPSVNSVPPPLPTVDISKAI